MAVPGPDHLNRAEWNGAYFLGLEDIFVRGCRCNVEQQVRRGMDLLAEAGYSFSQAVATSSPSPHEQATREIGEGSFDAIRRARCATAWLRQQVPHLRSAWLKALLQTYDALHANGCGAGRAGV